LFAIGFDLIFSGYSDPMRSIIILLLFLLGTHVANSQTISAGGVLEGNVTWDADTVKIFDNVVVNSNASLTIKPGTHVSFDGEYNVTIYGALVAKGTAQDSISFIATDTTRGWAGIHFYYANANPDSSILEYCTIKYAKYAYASGITAENTPRLRIQHCRIERNTPQYTNGGGISLYNNANAVIRDCLITRNHANTGGGIYASNCSPLIERNKIIKNRSYYGGGIAMYSCSALLRDNFIAYNNAAWNGGGIQSSYSTGTVTRNTIVKNISSNACAADLNSSGEKWEGNTIAFNNASAWEGTSVYIQGSMTPELVNNIIFFNRSQSGFSQLTIYYLNYTPLRISNCDIQYGYTGIYNYNQTSVEYRNNIDADPLFKDAAHDDFGLSWANFPVEDNTKSPCIDKGDPTLRLDPDGSGSDIGAATFYQEGKHFPPRASFSVDSVDGFKSLTVHFRNTSEKGSSDLDSYLWDFGDGTTSGDAEPTHTYTGIGKFTVTLKITDKNGLSHEITKTELITMYDGHFIAGEAYGTFGNDGEKYYIGGDVLVPVGKTLAIEPGVVLKVKGHFKIHVAGNLIAQGTAENPIIFTSYDTTGYSNRATENYDGGWNGITIVSQPSGDSTILDYVQISHVKNNDGALRIEGNSLVRISNSHVTFNSCISGGAGLYINGCSPKIIGNFIAYNNAGFVNSYSYYREGGGIYISGGEPWIVKNIIYSNHAEGDGGGLMLRDARPKLINNVISYNRSEFRGGGIATYGSGYFKVVNNTIVNNTSRSGGGVFSMYGGRIDYFNCILSANSPDNINVSEYYLELGFRNCLITGGKASITKVVPQNIFYYINCLDAPAGIAPGAKSYGRLVASSAGINKGYEKTADLGLPATDLLGIERIKDDRIDIGAYEYTPLPLPTVLKPEITVEQNEDFLRFELGLDSLFEFEYGLDHLEVTFSQDQPITNTLLVGRTVQIQSLPNLFGEQILTITANSGEATVESTVQLSVKPVNDPPTVRYSPGLSAYPNFETQFVDLRELFTDVDSDLSGRYYIGENAILEGIRIDIDDDFLKIFPEKDRLGSSWIPVYVTDGEYSSSTAVTFYIYEVTESEDLMDGVSIAPNPTASIVSLHSPTKKITVDVFDSTGKKICLQENILSENETQYDLRSFPSGIYMFMVRSADQRKVFRVLKVE
jgi:PKD repeat protein